jgi:putative ABC transport system permease protein
MSWLDALRHRLRTALRPTAHERELAEEMRHHLELDAREVGGMREARRRFGDELYYREEVRRLTLRGLTDRVRLDLLATWRHIRQSPGVMLLVTATLAIGVGANAAVFSVLDGLYLRPPAGVEAPSSVRRVWVERSRADDPEARYAQSLSFPSYATLAAAMDGAGTAAVYEDAGEMRHGSGQGSARVRVVYSSASYFDALGVRPRLGRFFEEEEARPGASGTVAVVSHRFWTRQLGADPRVLGSDVVIGGSAYSIIGVADRGFTGLDLRPVDVWLPIAAREQPPWLDAPWWESAVPASFQAVIRLHDAIPVAEVEARATVAIREAQRQMLPRRPASDAIVRLAPIMEARGPAPPRGEMTVAARLGVVAFIVLVIAGTNTTGLLLVNGMRRQRDLAVRSALGASRWRLVRMLTLEALLLAFCAGAAALVLANWMGAFLAALIAPGLEVTREGFDVRVAAFTMAVALLAGLLVGLVPALRSSRVGVAPVLAGEDSYAGRTSGSLRGALVAGQTALSLTLLVGAALFIRSLHNVQALRLGIDHARLVAGTLHADDMYAHAGADAAIAAAMREIVARLREMAEIEGAARAGREPMGGGWNVPYFVEGDSLHPPGTTVLIPVAPGYLATVGTQLLRGRDLDAPDSDGRPFELVVNEAAAARLWPGREALGRCVRFGERENPCYTVVGVAEDARVMHVFEEEAQPQFYTPLGNPPAPYIAGSVVVVRARNDPRAAAELLRQELSSVFPAAEAEVMLMAHRLEPETRQWRAGARLFTLFGLLALGVAVVGVYSSVAFDVALRRREFGIRLAMGATMRGVMMEVLRRAVRVVGLGIGTGVVLALVAGRALDSLLYGIASHDPGTFAAVAAGLLAVAVVGAVGPALRAASTDPYHVLRAD